MQEIHRRYVHEEKPAKISSKKKIFYFLFSFFQKSHQFRSEEQWGTQCVREVEMTC